MPRSAEVVICAAGAFVFEFFGRECGLLSRVRRSFLEDGYWVQVCGCWLKCFSAVEVNDIIDWMFVVVERQVVEW